MGTREQAFRAHQSLLNGSGKLGYFELRGITEETITRAYIGCEAGAFTYPCRAKAGDFLGIHFKSEARNDEGRRRQWWDEYADNLPPKGHGKNPDAPAKVIPFGMETLEGLVPGSLVILCCGEEDALSFRQAGYTALSQPGAGLLEPVYAKELASFEVIVFYDAGEEREARKDALKLEAAGTANVRVVKWPEGVAHGTDVNGQLVEDPEGFNSWLQDMIDAAEPLTLITAEEAEREGEPDEYVGKDGQSDGRKPTQAELLVRCASGVDLFHTSAGDSYATTPVSNHQETHPIRSKGFRRWLVRGFFERYRRPPGAQALQDALGLLEARAQFDGPQREVHVRVAEHGGGIYVDLANERWEAVEITSTGWRVISDPPVHFRRPRGMLPLPAPTRGGLVKELRRFVNIPNEDEASWVLLLAWLVQAFRPTGPYPVLILQGEQGSAKSTVERLLRALVDPSTAPLRTTPRNERDLIIAATNSWCVAFDNISNLPPWTSDALCRLSTGGGFSARELYTDSEEVLFDATRPVILNGITEVATRPDLLDRALIVTLPPIPEEKRKPEAGLWRDFERLRLALLGALFDAVSGALGTVEDVRLGGMPRMADFAVWATAAEESLGLEPGAFMEAYAGNRREATESALEADPVAVAVRELMQDRQRWAGTATDLWKALNDLTDDDVRHTKAWPSAPNSLTNRLKRLAPALRGIGIEYGEARTGSKGTRLKTLTNKEPAKDRQSRQDRQPYEEDLQNEQEAADDVNGCTDDTDSAFAEDCQRQSAANEEFSDDTDSSDDSLWGDSKRGWRSDGYDQLADERISGLQECTGQEDCLCDECLPV